MNASKTGSSQDLLDSATQGDASLPASAGPSDPLRSPPLDDEWLDLIARNMKRMTTDEGYRLEIAQRLS